MSWYIVKPLFCMKVKKNTFGENLHFLNWTWDLIRAIRLVQNFHFLWNFLMLSNGYSGITRNLMYFILDPCKRNGQKMLSFNKKTNNLFSVHLHDRSKLATRSTQCTCNDNITISFKGGWGMWWGPHNRWDITST